MSPQSKKNQVKNTHTHKHTHTHTHTFSLGIHNYQVLPLVTRGQIYQQNLSIHYLSGWGSKKQQRRRQNYSNFTQEKLFQSHKKLSAILDNFTLLHPPLPLLLPFGQVVNMHGPLFEKKLSDLFQSPIPIRRAERR